MDWQEFVRNQRKTASRMIEEIEKVMTINSLRAESRSMDITFSGYRNVTGNLRRSTFGRVERRDDELAIVLSAGGRIGGVDVNYARKIEFGTSGRNGGRGIRPRLFLGRSMAIAADEVRDDLKPIFAIASRLRTQ